MTSFKWHLILINISKLNRKTNNFNAIVLNFQTFVAVYIIKFVFAWTIFYSKINIVFTPKHSLSK